MSKAKLIEKAVEAGLDATGTVAQLKDRLEVYRMKPKVVVDAEIGKNSKREKYRNSAHVPKGKE